MNPWERLKYEVWPVIKVRGKYYYWILRYGGKKRIPREVVFGSMAKSLQRMNDNLEKAARIGADDPNTSAQEVRQALDALKKAGELNDSIERISKEKD